MRHIRTATFTLACATIGMLLLGVLFMAFQMANDIYFGVLSVNAKDYTFAYIGLWLMFFGFFASFVSYPLFSATHD